MVMLSMPGFLPALRAARAQRPDIPADAFQRAARTARREFARLRVTPAFIVRWAEFYTLTARVA